MPNNIAKVVRGKKTSESQQIGYSKKIVTGILMSLCIIIFNNTLLVFSNHTV